MAPSYRERERETDRERGTEKQRDRHHNLSETRKLVVAQQCRHFDKQLDLSISTLLDVSVGKFLNYMLATL
jgi:hypothetical protein